METKRSTLARRFRYAAALATAALTPGCLFGGLRVEEVGTSAAPPANVAVYVSVSRGDAPVTSLTASSFAISEDGQPIPPDQSKQTLLPRDVAAVHRTVLLVDMSGPVAEGDTRTHIEMAVTAFVTRVRATQPVTVFAFDGAPAIRLLGDFPQADEAVTELPAIATYEQRDPSSNLHGAVVEALTQLDARLMSAQKPIRVGALVVFLRGPDLAGRVTEGKLSELLGDTKHQTFAIVLGEPAGLRPSRFGDDGVFTAPGLLELAETFDKASGRVADAVAQHYLLSYCSPARAGTRRLKVEITSKGDTSKDEKDPEAKELKGYLTTQFDATGFSAGCDPNAPPRFVVRATATPPPQAQKERDEKPPSPKRPAPEADEEEGDEVAPPPVKPGYAQ